MADETPLDRFERRVGPTHFRQRFYMQVDHIAKLYERQRTIQYYQNVDFLVNALYYALKFSGLYRFGYRNSRNIRVTRNTFTVRGLPASFDGYRILHLSDLHVDVDSRFPRRLAERLQGLDYDLCVITGDFRNSTHGNYVEMIEGMREIVPHIKTNIYAVLGNHDFLEFVTPLEEMGVRFLLNESVELECGEGTISLAGIDDAYFYEMDNLPRALDDVPAGSVSVLLSHSPETYRLAAACGCDVMLAGHTHGGQICLPGGVTIVAYANCPRRMIRGPWSHDRLQGYTSVGAGSCGLPVRFFCPPEVTIHTLRSPSS
jgi:predicted MPP superfamily phosphohydrolase